ncbi:Hpt domain-containing protein [Vibrio sp. Sgm 5]|uniref:Hpt domain-containing protein n=1 Tax=Vibrio sp. Sgm 5 TaxID=2994387 RepID=UPI002248F67B|nr:Hpt domain-containing protein [Vibrio sp. Sgm 5]MCX2791096.1 Hpt domain-containing protein [Vibrio sp. Sgm 5]
MISTKVRSIALIKYRIDEPLFEKSTGVEFTSSKGIHFRKLAVSGLKDLHIDVIEQNYSNKILAHRLKGIVFACGLSNVASVCQKLELYDGVLNEKRTRTIISDMALNSICSLSI